MLYRELFGPYPYPEYGLVLAQNAYHGAMEYSGLISLSHTAFRTYNGQPTALLVYLTAHEIAHQWWYLVVGNDQVHEPWLDESLAKYSEVLFYERYYPEHVDWWWEQHIYRRDFHGPLNRTLYDFEDTSTYIGQVYSQGARFIGDLRAEMGERAFFAFLKRYRAAGEGRLMRGEDFFRVLEGQTDADLTPIIERYFTP